MRSGFSLALVVTMAALLGSMQPVGAEQLSVTQAEEQGIDLVTPSPAPASGPAVPRSATLELDPFLLIPDSTSDRVMSFDATTGDLIDPDFIRSDSDHLATPIHAILSSSKDSILVSDQINDVVQEYAINGGYRRVFAPAGGVNTAILDNIRGMALRDNGNLLVTVGGGSNASSVAEFDTDGNYLGNYVAISAGGLNSPFDVLLTTEALVGAISSDAVHRYELATGTYIANLIAVNSFPEQLALASNGNLLIANFSGTQAGVMEVAMDGTLVGTYTSSQTGLRGVYQLLNGNLLITNSNGVHEVTKAGTVVETKYAGANARFIELIVGAIPVELQTFSVE